MSFNILLKWSGSQHKAKTSTRQNTVLATSRLWQWKLNRTVLQFTSPSRPEKRLMNKTKSLSKQEWGGHQITLFSWNMHLIFSIGLGVLHWFSESLRSMSNNRKHQGHENSHWNYNKDIISLFNHFQIPACFQLKFPVLSSQVLFEMPQEISITASVRQQKKKHKHTWQCKCSLILVTYNVSVWCTTNLECILECVLFC